MPQQISLSFLILVTSTHGACEEGLYFCIRGFASVLTGAIVGCRSLQLSMLSPEWIHCMQ